MVVGMGLIPGIDEVLPVAEGLQSVIGVVADVQFFLYTKNFICFRKSAVDERLED